MIFRSLCGKEDLLIHEIDAAHHDETIEERGGLDLEYEKIAAATLPRCRAVPSRAHYLW